MNGTRRFCPGTGDSERSPYKEQLRAEIDGIVAHLYGLTRDEFAYIPTTFPLVKDPVKNAALAAFDAIGRGESGHTQSVTWLRGAHRFTFVAADRVVLRRYLRHGTSE